MKKRYLFAIVTLSLSLVLYLFADAHTKKTEILSMHALVQDSEEPAFNTYNETLVTRYPLDQSWALGQKFNTATQPNTSAQSAILVELDSGKILYEKNSSEKMKIASLVKIMTAIVALEHADLDKEIKISARAANIGENSMGLTEGETYTLKELLYGLILNSGNDSAYAIAEGVAGDVDTFVGWMNIKAEELNLLQTQFADPSGLDDSTFSTAADLVRLSRYALKHQQLRDIARTVNMSLSSDEHKNIFLENQTNLLTTYPGVNGLKTGYTEEAGLCLITSAFNNGKEVVGVVLNSGDRRGDMIVMLDHGFSSLGIAIEHNLLDF